MSPATHGTGDAPLSATDGCDADRSLLAAATAALIDWYAHSARDLPWRRTREPYRILVSEVMLQQTRVEAVRDRYDQFLARFPDLESLAGAHEDEVLAAWSGLGYYRRARSLHRLARQLVREGDGRLPTDPEGLRRLPGIGDYTSAAVASIAFGVPALTVDGNVARVLSRLLALYDDARRAPVRRRLESDMAASLRAHAPGDLNQALMELGARVCLPTSPRCALCPCARHCRARELGVQEQLPPRRKTTVREVEEAAAVIERRGRYLLFRGQRPGVLQSMWEFPTLDSRLRDVAVHEAPADKAADEAADEPADDDRLAAQLRSHLEELGIATRTGARIGTIRHGITDRRIRCHVYRAALKRQPARGSPAQPERVDAAWHAAPEVAKLPIAASTRRILDLLSAASSTP